MRFFSFVYRVYHRLMEKNYSTLSGAIAFFLVINGGSLVYLMILLSGFFNMSIDTSNVMAKTLISSVTVATSQHNFFYTLFFIGTSIYGASSLFFHLIKTGEIIYEEPNTRFTIFRRLTSILFLSVFLFIIESFFIILVISKYIFSNFFWQIFRYFLFLIIPYLLAVCINFFVTPHEVKYKEIRQGSFLTTIFWYVISILFSIYTSIFTNYKAIYGALTFFIVFMIWLYLMAQGLVIGMIFNFYIKTKNAKKLNLIEGNTIEGTP